MFLKIYSRNNQISNNGLWNDKNRYFEVFPFMNSVKNLLKYYKKNRNIKKF
jgi:hypothetical protein